MTLVCVCVCFNSSIQNLRFTILKGTVYQDKNGNNPLINLCTPGKTEMVRCLWHRCVQKSRKKDKCLNRNRQVSEALCKRKTQRENRPVFFFGTLKLCVQDGHQKPKPSIYSKVLNRTKKIAKCLTLGNTENKTSVWTGDKKKCCRH